METNDIDVVALDVRMPHIPGDVLLPEIRSNHPDVPIIMISGLDDIELAVECMRNGSFDYMVKPVEESRLISGVRRALEMRELYNENLNLKRRFLSRELEHPEAFSTIVTHNEQMYSLFLYAEAIAKTTQPVLITGETGVGKDLFARALHTLSGRSGAFVVVNIAGFDDSLFSDTLFGHKRGAFTGAVETRKGLVEQARHGTLFLDEIGELNNTSQVKLLRLIEVREYFPIGSDVVRRSDARIVLATNRDLLNMVNKGRFRRDLYYRLSTHQVEVPPLRERKADLPPLINHFLEKAAFELKKKKPPVPAQLYQLAESYRFPGNIRELQSLIFDAVSRHEAGTLSLQTMKEKMGFNRQPVDTEETGSSVSFSDTLPTLKQANELLIEEAMRRAGGNQSLAARSIGLTQQALSKRLERKRKKNQPS
jgi:DNA-binding NtrC family response regulator